MACEHAHTAGCHSCGRSSRRQPNSQGPHRAAACLALLGHADGASPTPGGLGVLAAHADAPVVAQAAVVADLLQALQVVTHLGVQDVGHHLGVPPVLVVLLPGEVGNAEEAAAGGEKTASGAQGGESGGEHKAPQPRSPPKSLVVQPGGANTLVTKSGSGVSPRPHTRRRPSSGQNPGP
jgi:hypothetical protein